MQVAVKLYMLHVLPRMLTREFAEKARSASAVAEYEERMEI